jgi:hypothetical protein
LLVAEVGPIACVGATLETSAGAEVLELDVEADCAFAVGGLVRREGTGGLLRFDTEGRLTVAFDSSSLRAGATPTFVLDVRALPEWPAALDVFTVSPCGFGLIGGGPAFAPVVVLVLVAVDCPSGCLLLAPDVTAKLADGVCGVTSAGERVGGCFSASNAAIFDDTEGCAGLSFFSSLGVVA